MSRLHFTHIFIHALVRTLAMAFPSLAVAITAAMLSYHGPMDFNCTATPLEVSWPGALKLCFTTAFSYPPHFSNQQVGVDSVAAATPYPRVHPVYPGFTYWLSNFILLSHPHQHSFQSRPVTLAAGANTTRMRPVLRRRRPLPSLGPTLPQDMC